ncbi:MAG: D-tyrosyl-tRNA(Tyr) deacylase [Chloroflexota bacterium]
MRAVVQRVSRGAVRVGDELVAEIGRGVVVLVGVGRDDSEANARRLAEKVAHLRIFPDEADRMNRSVLDIGGEVLVVSQFTLLADTSRGRRPSFVNAAPPDQAEPLVSLFARALQELGLTVKTGRFGAQMLVEVFNDGPVTIILEA